MMTLQFVTDSGELRSELVLGDYQAQRLCPMNTKSSIGGESAKTSQGSEQKGDVTRHRVGTMFLKQDRNPWSEYHSETWTRCNSML